MNKQYLVQVSQDLYDREQVLKNSIKSGKKTSASETELIIPKLLFDASLELELDQWFFNGFIIRINGQLIIVDPGVDFYSRFRTTGLSVNDICAMIITHNHIDHTGSVQIMLEQILKCNNKGVTIFCSKDAYDTKVPDYYKNKLEQSENVTLELLSDNQGSWNGKILGKFNISFVPLFHSCPDTFGFKLNIGSSTIGYISDTGYSIKIKTDQGTFESKEAKGNFLSIEEKHQQIADFFRDVHTVVVNVNALEFNKHSKYHLSGWDILDIFKNSDVKQIVLQHISPINADGEDSGYLFKLFFRDEGYQVILPHYLGRRIKI